MELDNKKPAQGNFLQFGELKKTIKFEDFLSKSSDEIIFFIIDHYHANLRKTIPNLTKTLLKIMDHHIHEYKDLFWEIHEIFSKIRGIFESHLILEEKLIFEPMKKFNSQKITKNSPEYELMERSIKEAVEEHYVIGPSLKKITDLTNDFVAPKNACGSISKFYLELKEFKDDVITHSQIENSILFPRFVDL